jgi:hypothetical protein
VPHDGFARSASVKHEEQLRMNQEQIDALLEEAENEPGNPIPNSPELWNDLRNELEEFIRAEELK